MIPVPDKGEWVRKRCKPCEGKTVPMTFAEAEKYVTALGGWSVREDGRALRKEYRFKNFRAVIGFFNRIAEISETENHHPDLKISYSRVGVELSTHAIRGLSENDFILASKFDAEEEAA